jgi:hypothetical protein
MLHKILMLLGKCANINYLTRQKNLDFTDVLAMWRDHTISRDSSISLTLFLRKKDGTKYTSADLSKYP